AVAPDRPSPEPVPPLRPLQVAVCGPRECTEAQAAQAHRIGQLLAAGGGPGGMAGGARGAGSAGGLVVGVRPGPDGEDASPDLSVTLVTNMGEARNRIIVWRGGLVG